jgi:hypothetical protein
VPALAVVAAIYFLIGALVNAGDVSATVDGGGFLAVAEVVVQLAGLAVSGAAGCLALRGPARSRARGA